MNAVRADLPLPVPVHATRMADCVAFTAILLLFSLLVIPPILLGLENSQQAIDMRDNHLPQVNTFIAAPFSLFSYRPSAATTPGQHVVLAWFARILGYTSIGTRTLPVRLANAAFGYLVVATVWAMLRRLTGDLRAAFALTLPIACSSYVLFAAIWINTDDGALWFYTLIVAGGMLLDQLPAGMIALAAAMVFWRQIYLPVTGAFAVQWAGKALSSSPGSAVVPALAILVPGAIVAAYLLEWGALTPPGFQLFNGSGCKVAVPLSALALVGLFLPVYALYIGRPVLVFLRRHRLAALLLCLGVLGVWLIGPTSYDNQDGRWGAVIWVLAKALPTIGSRSPIVLAAATAGAIVLAALLVEGRKERALPFEVVALCLYFIGYSGQVEAFQRYIEAPILFTYAVSATRHEALSRHAWIGPVLLAAVLASASMLRAYGGLPRLLH